MNVDGLRAALDRTGYLADEGLATALFLAVAMGQPILLEGEPGVGKTEAAKALAAAVDTPLLRLQCYEGLTAAEALYEWNYPRQLLAIRLAESRGENLRDADLFTREHLLARPLLAAAEHRGPRPAVLLIDEIDRADDEFEAFLFEMLAEAAVTIPELGTVTAAVPPVAVLTSNRTRDLHDALKRRCLYHWIAYPAPGRVAEIVRRRVPGAAGWLAEPYARALIQLLYCAAGADRAEVFVFATRLTRLTRALARTPPDVALHRAAQLAPDWSGGTRIGEALRAFNAEHGRRGLARGAVVLVLSDGWDTGDPDLVGRELARLRRVAHRIVWANPRTRHAGYRPLVGGMAAAWPHCDAVVSAHSLDALEDLLGALATSGTPARPWK